MDAPVLVVGAGPVGLTLAAELARHGVRARVIDKLAAPSVFCRAIGVTPRSLEMFEDMGVAREMIDAGLWLDGMRMLLPGQPPRDMRRDLSDLPYAALGVPQYETERVLTAHLAQFGIAPERAVTLASLVQTDDGVTCELEGPQGRQTAAFRFVVGCDGAHSAVRKAVGIAFEGEGWPFDFMLGDVSIAWDVPRGLAASRPWRRSASPHRTAAERTTASRPTGPVPALPTSRRLPTGCCRSGHRSAICGGPPSSGFPCASPRATGTAMSSSPATPATSIRRPAARA
jgi:2-polyprenyl-6-methoxyphenol hydroxylase-like FAD-dependent oxidoreductase